MDKKMNDDKLMYRTNDMGMAAFLQMQGHQVQDAQVDGSGTVYFFFFPTDHMLQQADAFLNGSALVEPKSYNREYGAIKSLFQQVRHRH